MLTDLLTYKAFAEIADGSEDVKLNVMLPGVDAAIKNWLGRPSIEPQATYTEYYGGNNTDVLRLRQRPVFSITAAYYDAAGYYGQAPGAFDPVATLLTAGQDYALVPDQPDGSSVAGKLQRLNGVWLPSWSRARGLLSTFLAPGRGNYKVVYVAGYATVPADLQLAANLVVSRVRQSAPRGGLLTNESYEGYSYALLAGKGQGGADDEFLGPARSILYRYRALDTY